MTDEQLIRQALEDICGARLCEINSMSSRKEMLRLLDKAAEALRARLSKSVQSIDTSTEHVDESAKHKDISSPAELRRRINAPWDDKAGY